MDLETQQIKVQLLETQKALFQERMRADQLTLEKLEVLLGQELGVLKLLQRPRVQEEMESHTPHLVSSGQ